MKVALIQMFALHLFRKTELLFAQDYIQLSITEVREAYERSVIAMVGVQSSEDNIWCVEKFRIRNGRKDSYKQLINLEVKDNKGTKSAINKIAHSVTGRLTETLLKVMLNKKVFLALINGNSDCKGYLTFQWKKSTGPRLYTACHGWQADASDYKSSYAPSNTNHILGFDYLDAVIQYNGLDIQHESRQRVRFDSSRLMSEIPPLVYEALLLKLNTIEKEHLARLKRAKKLIVPKLSKRRFEPLAGNGKRFRCMRHGPGDMPLIKITLERFTTTTLERFTTEYLITSDVYIVEDTSDTEGASQSMCFLAIMPNTNGRDDEWTLGATLVRRYSLKMQKRPVLQEIAFHFDAIEETEEEELRDRKFV